MTRESYTLRFPPEASPAASYAYDPYGNAATTTGTVVNPLRYAGEYRDDSGLIYLRARYYDPATAQFLSRDPIETVTGQQPYSYVGGSPLNGVDPSGLLCSATAQAGRAAPALVLEAFLARAGANVKQRCAASGPAGVLATQTGDRPLRLVYEHNPKHGTTTGWEGGREISRRPHGGQAEWQAILDASVPDGPIHRRGIEPDTRLTVVLRRHLAQELECEEVWYYHGFVPGG